MASAFGIFILWVISMFVLILVIAQGVRVGMRWSRKAERIERVDRGDMPESGLSTYRKGESMFNYKPKDKSN